MEKLKRWKSIRTLPSTNWNGTRCSWKIGCEQNVSNTISYDPSEVPAIIDWLTENWDSYVGVSFLFRNDPSKNAEDLGYAYLPQEVVTKEMYDAYSQKLKPVDYTGIEMRDDELQESCSTGVCPIK